MQEDFAGKNGFVWFTGIVENRQDDPLKAKRIQVRIFGWHSEDRLVCPTSDLPWAQVLLPVNANKSFSLPREGEWVLGFFLDGEAGQMPVVMGVYPGLVSNTTMRVLSSASGATTGGAKSGNDRTTGQGNAFEFLPTPPRLPKFPQGQIEEQLGLPTIVKLSREVIDNTAIAFTNNVRSIFCSSDGFIAQSLAKAKAQIRIAAIAIREAFKKILAALGFSASAGGMLETIKSITKYIKQLNDLINDVKDWVKKIKEILRKIIFYLNELKRLVQLLRKLPALLIQQIKRCLQKALKELKAAILDSLKEELTPIEITDLLANVSGLIANAQSLVNETSDIPGITNQFSEFFNFSTTIKTGNDSATISLNDNNTLLQSDNVSLANTYLFDENGNPSDDVTNLGNLEPRERENFVYNIFPGSQRFSFSSVKLA